MSNYILAPELNKIVFSSQLVSNFSELIVNLFDVCFQCGKAIPAVPSILSLLQSPVAHFTISAARLCGPVFF